MLSRENRVVLLFVAAGLLLAFGGRTVTNLSDDALIVLLLFVGVLAPQLLNGYLDNRNAD